MNVETMNKQELRAACREHGIRYSGLKTVAGMRAALAAVLNGAEQEHVAVGDLAKDAGAYFEHFGGDEGYNLDQDPTPEMGEDAIPLLEPKVEAKVFADADGHGAGARLLNTPEARAQYEEEVVKPAQAARESRNGVKMPGEGTKCRAVWDQCDTLVANGVDPTQRSFAHALRAWSDENGLNVNNTSIEASNWRKFHGYARGKKA